VGVRADATELDDIAERCRPALGVTGLLLLSVWSYRVLRYAAAMLAVHAAAAAAPAGCLWLGAAAAKCMSSAAAMCADALVGRKLVLLYTSLTECSCVLSYLCRTARDSLLLALLGVRADFPAKQKHAINVRSGTTDGVQYNARAASLFAV
jgi:hypothetical protein